MDRRVTPSKRVTSPTWGHPPPCKQGLINCFFAVLVAIGVVVAVRCLTSVLVVAMMMTTTTDDDAKTMTTTKTMMMVMRTLHFGYQIIFVNCTLRLSIVPLLTTKFDFFCRRNCETVVIAKNKWSHWYESSVLKELN